ncbi:hypothetical protein [Paracidovorax sp. MALMAid1276]|uniref:hypothetical protein n=1 Tax=Paracidovorax sp. MALMAid1276 TaxID=3411631 RepID=UPI003B9A1A77
MTPHAAAPQQPADAAARGKSWKAWAWGTLAALACLLVFGLYTAPDFMVMLADQVWACF